MGLGHVFLALVVAIALTSTWFLADAYTVTTTLTGAQRPLPTRSSRAYQADHSFVRSRSCGSLSSSPLPSTQDEVSGEEKGSEMIQDSDISKASTSLLSIADCLEILYRAAETRQEEASRVYQALVDLERNMRNQAKADYPQTAQQTVQALHGDWRLIFTTGTANTQQKFGRINYFPLKAIQSFRTIPEDHRKEDGAEDAKSSNNNMLIENGIYVGDWPVIKFKGTMDFDLKKRRLSFDFDQVGLLGNLWTVSLGRGGAAQLGAKTGLGAESNVENAAQGRQAFFNWISADDRIATARGGGGGLALWKRIDP